MIEIKNKTNLASNQENGKKEHGIFALVAAAVVLLFFGSFLWLLIKKPSNNNINNNSQPLTYRNSCRQDSDCVLASKYYINEYGQSSCCPMNCEQEAVNIETKTKEAAERDKLCATKDYQCPVFKCVKQFLKETICEQDKCVVTVGANETSSNINTNATELNNILRHKGVDWDLPIDLQLCDITERRTSYWSFGSKNVTAKDHKNNVCVLEYTNEIEGGYTISECSIPDSLGTVLASQLPLLEYCKETKSGNMLLGN